MCIRDRNIDLTQEQFYEKLTAGGDIKTSMPLVGDVTDKWDEFLKENDEIVYIPMSVSYTHLDVYKRQLRQFFMDLQDPDYESAIATVHSRFSTNTNPSWERSHPNRFIVHNGEINTILGNSDKMSAREENICLLYTSRCV